MNVKTSVELEEGRAVQWTESIVIDAPAEVVRIAMMDQAHVMGWSAWPEATGFTCAVEGDGSSPGSEIVFRNDDGQVQGRQRIVKVDDQVIHNVMENKGPFGKTLRPSVDFRVTPIGQDRTRASLEFEAALPFPPILRRLVRIPMSRWVRNLHRKDMAMLKEYVESGRVRGEEH
ncbi:MAG: SRPBCC family protein [Euzebya tangerina]